MKQYMQYIILLMFFFTCTVQLPAQVLSLDSCKQYALENNKRIKEARLNVRASEEIKKNAYTNFFPKVNAQVFTVRSSDYLLDIETPGMDLPVYDGNPASLENPTQFAYVPAMNIQALDYLNVGMVTATQPVYAGGKIRSGYRLATLGTEISKENLDLSTRDVIVKTEEYYWSLVSLQTKKRTLESYEKLLNNLLKDVNVSYDAGLIKKSDLLKVEMELNEVEANKLKLDNGIEMLKMTLCQHIGISYSESVALQDTAFLIETPEKLYVSPEEALLNRTEYQLLNDAVNAEVLQKRLSTGDYLPQIAVGVQGQYLDIIDQQNTYGIAFATLSIPISDWWGGNHKIKEHNIKIDIAKNNLNENVELLKLQIAQSFNELQESFKQISVAESRVVQANEHVRVITDNYNAGIVSTSDLLEAQAMYQESQDGLVDAKSTYQIRQVYYKQAISKLGLPTKQN